MARKALAKDQVVKLIVGAGQASPSPPVGPALGSKGVKSMDFCKEFNARTANIVPGTPLPVRVTVRPDRSFAFETRTPATAHLLLAAAGAPEKQGRPLGAGVPGTDGGDGGGESGGGKASGREAVAVAGTVSLKHVYEIARIKQTELRLAGLSLEALSRSVLGTAKSVGVKVVP